MVSWPQAPVLAPTIFQPAHADACADHACHLMADPQALPLADQDGWLLLHSSLQQRVTHLSQGSPRNQEGPDDRSRGWCFYHSRIGLGRGTNHEEDHPAPPPLETGPDSHKTHQRGHRVPYRRASCDVLQPSCPLQASAASSSTTCGKCCMTVQPTCCHLLPPEPRGWPR
jgi:hypothetical protein